MGHNHLKKEFWQKQQVVYDKIRQAGGFLQYLKTVPDLKKAFKSDKVVRCMDEGVKGGGVRSAGSGIVYVLTEGIAKGLRGELALQAGIDKAAAVFKNKVKGWTAHEECGAAAKVFQAMPEEIKLKFENNPDLFGQYFVKKLAEHLNQEFIYIPFSQMNRPEHLHVARCTYFDKTGCFNIDEIPELPPGFTVSAHLDEKEALKELDLSIQIALGDHGFGDLIREEEPFRVVVIGDSKLDHLQRKLKIITKKYKGRVRVEEGVRV